MTVFRTEAGLPENSPAVILVGEDPGLVSGEQDESTLDVEWSGAVAPSTTVKFMVGASTATSDGVDLSAQYIVKHALAPVVSTSYGSCEQQMGAAELAFYNSLWEQAASQGMSSFVASGDAGAAGCSYGSAYSGPSTAVTGLCNSPYSTCVGGTEFNEGSNYAAYRATTNSTGYGLALGYLPEVVWNESGSNGGTGLWASGGGASQVYAHPSWQQKVSGTSGANGMRAVPDVAMSAACHGGYIIYENGSSWVISGTSAAAPSFAALMALVVESQGGTGQGNANAGLYPLLNVAHNPFHATPSGNNSGPGVNGFTASGALYNLATGLGSVDGAVLASSWGASADFALSASATSGTVIAGNSATFTLSATQSGSATGDGLISSQNVTLQVQHAPSIQLAVSPTSLTVLSQSTAEMTVTVTPVGGLTATPNAIVTRAELLAGPPMGIRSPLRNSPILGVTGTSISLIPGLPQGFTATWSAPTATSSGAIAWTLTLTGSSTLNRASQVTATRTGAIYTASLNVPIAVTRTTPAFRGIKPMLLNEGTLRRGADASRQTVLSLQ